MMNRKWRIIIHISCLVFLMSVLSPWNVVGETTKPPEYNVAWVPTGVAGTTYGIATAAATLINKYSPLPGLPKIQVSVIPGKGTTVHTRQLVEGKIDVGLSSPDVAGDAYNGRGDWAKFGAKGKDFRILLPVSVNAVQIISMWDGPVKSFQDIKGKRLGEMSKAMAMQKIDASIFAAAGWDEDRDMKTTYYENVATAFDGLRDGHADVIVQFIGYPSAGGLELFSVKHCRLISIPDGVVKKAVSNNKILFPHTIAPNQYRKQDYPVPTVALILFWGVTTKMPSDVAYEICKILHQYYKEGDEMNKLYSKFLELFQKGEIPYHPGAEKYWREVGLIKW